MNRHSIFRAALIGAAVALTAGTAAADPTIVLVDPPGSTGTSTSANSLSKKGELTGAYGDSQSHIHGFLRKKSGAFITVGADGDQPMASNDRRVVAGVYPSSGWHGFVVAKDGSITRFDAPGADGSGTGTVPLAVNNKGEIAGKWATSARLNHGFVREPTGDIATFDAPGAGTQLDQGTFVQAMNAKGFVCGYYMDQASGYHGFLRSSRGKVTEIDAAGAGSGAARGTQIFAMNDKGAVSGVLFDSMGASHGFVIDAHGSQTTFDIPNRSNMLVTGMNNAGDIVGYYSDSSVGRQRAFLRDEAGNLTIFDVSSGGDSFAYDINDKGVISGFYIDGFGGGHAFLRKP